MKKVISLLLAGVMTVSAVPVTYAADTNDHSLGTQVTYTAANNESYFITVPAALNPGQSGTVTLSGSWPDNKTVTVTADTFVKLTNSIKASDTKTLTVTFPGISEAGSNVAAQTFTETVSVEGISNALFGSWSGKFNYNVDASDALTSTTASGSYVVVNDVSPSQHDLSVNLSSDTITDFSSVNVTRYGSNLLDITQMLNECLTDNGDGSYKLSVVDEYKRSSVSFAVNIPANIPFVTGAEITEKNTLKENIIFATLQFADGTSETVTFAHVDFSTHSYQFDKQITNITLLLRRNNDYLAIGDYFNFKNAKINIGQEQPYQEYIAPQSVAASSDGTVSGLSSAAPGMALITDNGDVVINCEYKKKQ